VAVILPTLRRVAAFEQPKARVDAATWLQRVNEVDDGQPDHHPWHVGSVDMNRLVAIVVPFTPDTIIELDTGKGSTRSDTLD